MVGARAGDDQAAARAQTVVMLTTARRQSQILELRDQHGSLSVADIARDFGISAVTARHDLTVLADSGLIKRTRGGARVNTGSANEPNFEIRRRHRANEKRAIAQAASRFLGDAQIIALDASTTCYYLALELKPTAELFVVTNGLRTAEALVDRPHISVMLTGGILRRGGVSIVGETAQGQGRQGRGGNAFFCAPAFRPRQWPVD